MKLSLLLESSLRSDSLVGVTVPPDGMPKILIKPIIVLKNGILFICSILLVTSSTVSLMIGVSSTKLAAASPKTSLTNDIPPMILEGVLVMALPISSSS